MPAPLLNILKHLLVRRVRAVFNDRNKGERPVARVAEVLYQPGSVIWRVHGDVTTMMIGGGHCSAAPDASFCGACRILGSQHVP